MTMKGSLTTVQQQIDVNADRLDGYIRRADGEQAQRDALNKAQHGQLGEQISACGDRIAYCHSELLKHCADCDKKLERKPNASVAGAPRAAVSSDDLQGLANRIQKLETNQKVARDAQAALAARIDKVYDAAVDMVNERIAKLQGQMQEVGEPLSPIQEKIERSASSATREDGRDDRLAQLYATGNQNRVSLMNALAQLTAHSSQFDRFERRMDALEVGLGNLTAPPLDVVEDVHHDITVLGPKVRIVDERDMGDHNQLMRDLKTLSQRTNFMSQDLLKVKTVLGRWREEIRDVVLHIMDEFQVIRKTTPGLDMLPPLNLGSCIPSFFNNPSFSFSRDGPSDDDEEEDEYPQHRRMPEHDRGAAAPREPPPDQPTQTIPAFIALSRVRKMSGLLHLVSRPGAKQRNSDRTTSRQRSSQSGGGEDDDGYDETRARRGDPVTVQTIVRSTIPTEQMADLHSMIDTFLLNKNELMSAVDRKVDRDMIERLFNKFKTLIVNVNDRVNELASMMDKCAMQQDVDAVVRVVTHIPALSEASAGVKVGPECICCARGKTGIAGQVLPSLAMAAGGPSVNIQTPNNGAGGGFVYGDGGAYRGKGLLDSLPRLPVRGELIRRPLTVSGT
jgi:hypothetical protein